MLSAIKSVLQSPESKIEHICRTTGDARRLQRVLRSNPDVNVHLISFEGLFPLHLAALSGHAKVCELLIFGGFNVNPSVKSADGATPLHLAAWHGKVEILELLLERAGVSIDEASADGYTALHYACWGGMLDASKYLLKRGASVLAKSSFGYTPLIIAARSGMTEIVEHLLLNTSSEIDEGDINGCSALFHACWDGHRDVVRVLLKNGAKVAKADNRGRRAVDICKTRDIRELVQSVGLGASRSRRRRQGRQDGAPTSPSPSPNRNRSAVQSPPLTPGGSYTVLIQSRTALGSPRTLSGASSASSMTAESIGSTTLLDAPTPPRTSTSTSATLSGQRPVVRSFISFLGRNAATQSSTLAGSETDTATAQEGEEEGGGVGRGGMRGRSPSPRRFHAPLGPSQQQHQHQQSTSELSVLWPDADHDSDAGHSAASDHTDPAQVQSGSGFLAPSVVKEAWLLCTSSGSAKALYRLLRAYPALAADRRSRSKGRTSSPISVMRDAEDWTPLMRAAACGFTEIVQLLLLVGVEPSLTDGHGNTALHRAAWAGRDACVTTLLEKSNHSPEESDVEAFNASSADLFESSSGVVVVDPLNHAGNTPLHRAALHGHLEAVKALAARGASVLAADKLGWTALHHACSENHAAIVVFLLQSGADALAITKAAESPSELARDATIRRLLKAHVAWTMTHDGLEDAKQATRKALDKAIRLALQSDDAPKEDANAQSASASDPASALGSPSPAKAKAQGSAPKAALRSAIRTVAAANAFSKQGAKAAASPAPTQPLRRGAPASPSQGPATSSPRRVEVPVAAGPVDASDLLSALNRRKGRVAASDPPPPPPLPLPLPTPINEPQPQLQSQPQPQPESPAVAEAIAGTEARIKSLRERLMSRTKSSQVPPRAPFPPPPPVPPPMETASNDAASSAGAAPRKRATFASDVVFNEPREAAPATPAAALSGQQRMGGGESQDMLLFAVVLTQVFSAYSNSLSRAFYRWKHRDFKTVGISGGTPLSSWRQSLTQSLSTPNSSSNSNSNSTSTKAKMGPQVFKFDGFE